MASQRGTQGPEKAEVEEGRVGQQAFRAWMRVD